MKQRKNWFGFICGLIVTLLVITLPTFTVPAFAQQCGECFTEGGEPGFCIISKVEVQSLSDEEVQSLSDENVTGEIEDELDKSLSEIDTKHAPLCTCQPC